jgi:hypothetical protein
VALHDCGLIQVIVAASRFGRLLDLPEHPHEGDAQADNNGHKQQCQSRRCQRGEHSSNNHCSVIVSFKARHEGVLPVAQDDFDRDQEVASEAFR